MTTNIISVVNIIGSCPVKITDVNKHITRMLVYSAINTNANSPLLYSMLKPDTNSDSPSAKSNGVRLVSAKHVINHNTAIGRSKRMGHECCDRKICVISNLISIVSVLSKIKDILTSYEIVCAILRRAPNRAYLEFDDQPATNVEYTFILDTHRKYKIPYTIKYAG